jgi:hypothetical protein
MYLLSHLNNLPYPHLLKYLNNLLNYIINYIPTRLNLFTYPRSTYVPTYTYLPIPTSLANYLLVD